MPKPRRHNLPTIAEGAAALTLDRPWADDALCGPDTAELFFIQGRRGGGARSDAVLSAANKAAIELCYRCPVRRECYDHAREHPEPHSRIAGGVMWRREQWREGRDTR